MRREARRRHRERLGAPSPHSQNRRARPAQTPAPHRATSRYPWPLLRPLLEYLLELQLRRFEEGSSVEVRGRTGRPPRTRMPPAAGARDSLGSAQHWTTRTWRCSACRRLGIGPLPPAVSNPRPASTPTRPAPHAQVGPARPVLVEGEALDALIARLRSYLNGFDGAPWTAQRLAELLLEPANQYKQLHKLVGFNGGLEGRCGAMQRLHVSRVRPAPGCDRALAKTPPRRSRRLLLLRGCCSSPAAACPRRTRCRRRPCCQSYGPSTSTLRAPWQPMATRRGPPRSVLGKVGRKRAARTTTHSWWLATCRSPTSSGFRPPCPHNRWRHRNGPRCSNPRRARRRAWRRRFSRRQAEQTCSRGARGAAAGAAAGGAGPAGEAAAGGSARGPGGASAAASSGRRSWQLGSRTPGLVNENDCRLRGRHGRPPPKSQVNQPARLTALRCCTVLHSSTFPSRNRVHCVQRRPLCFSFRLCWQNTPVPGSTKPEPRFRPGPSGARLMATGAT